MPEDVVTNGNGAALPPDAATAALRDVLRAGRGYGRGDWGAGASVLVEFVSAHPNVPLSAAHARGGVAGDTLAALFSASGFSVEREFYVNDAQGSRPLRVFASAVYHRYRRRCGVVDADRRRDETEYEGGAFLDTLADRIYADSGDGFADRPAGDETPPGFIEAALRASQWEQSEALDAFGIRFDHWSRESEIAESGAVVETIEALRGAGYADTRGGGLWLHSTPFGDEADRMLLRADGTATYLAGDLAYHRAKFARGFDRLVDVWNADHATYVARTRAGMRALGFDPSRLDVVLVQAVRVLKDGTAVKGGVTGADGPTLRDLMEDLGRDRARFCLVLQPVGEPLDLDMDAVRRPSSPFSRIQAALQSVASPGLEGSHLDSIDGGLLVDPSEIALLRLVSEMPTIVEEATRALAAHRIPLLALTLAETILALADGPTKSPRLQHARAALRTAAGIALENALILIGISPVEAESTTSV